MRTKSIVLLVLALGCGLVASIGISQIMEQNKRGGGAAVETEAILIAMKPIASQEQLKADNVKLEQWPKNLIPKGALTKIEDVDGRRIKHAIAPGEPILQNKLVGEGDKRPTIDVPPGYRLAAVHADAVSAVGNLIQPGDRVDVLVYWKGFRGSDPGTNTILQDIKVFAVNDQWRPSDDKSGDAIATKNVTLLVTPEQAEKLTLATELGKLRLVLRSPDDTLKVESTDGTTPQELFTGTDGGDNLGAEKNFLAKSGKGLLALLGGKNKPQLQPQPALTMGAPAHQDIEQFTMELLEGPQSRTVEFTKYLTVPNPKWQSGGATSHPAYSPPPGAGDSPTPEAVLLGPDKG